MEGVKCGSVKCEMEEDSFGDVSHFFLSPNRAIEGYATFFGKHMKAYFIVWQNESLSWPRPTVV